MKGLAVLFVFLATALCLSPSPALAALRVVTPAEAALMSSAPAATVRDMPRPDPATMGPDVPWPVPGERLAPPDNPQVGDSWIWWLWIHYPMPPHFEQRVCTVRGKSDHAYVVVENSAWNVSIDQADVDMILERWENSSIGAYPDQGIYEIDSTAFGTPPDMLDNDPRIYLMWFDFQIASDGFFFDFDELPEGAVPGMHSNECEVLYLNTTSTGGPSGDYMISVAAHEFEHMIHWYHDNDEDLWVDEGMAELAMWLYGRPDVISSFNTQPDNSLTNWGSQWADYIQTYLWSLYFYERCGGHPAIHALVSQPMNGIPGYEATLDGLGYTANFADIFADWTVANFLDDTTIGDGRFGYAGEDLPAFSVAGTYSAYPVTNISRTVNFWAADYYRFQNFGDIHALRLSFDGSDNNRFAVWGLTIHAAAPTGVQRMTIDPATQSGTLDVPGLYDPADQVILVVASVWSSGTTTYVFGASASPADVAEGAPALAPSLALSAAPNPAFGPVALRLASSDANAGGTIASIDLFDAQGRLVRQWNEMLAGGVARFTWDGRATDGSRAAPGLYYARARAGGKTAESRVLVLR